jgi:diguanylate cyclase (GGDEF)-like protein
MLARESVHIIRTITHSPVTQSAGQLAQTRPAIAHVTQVGLQRAVGRYAEAARARIESGAPARDRDYIDAKRALQLALLEHLQPGGEITAGQLQRATPYIEHAQGLVLLADQRRQARIAYASQERGIADRIGTSLDHAWTIFGRTIARRSLLELRAELDVIRQRAEAVTSGEVLDHKHQELLDGAETAFAQTLNANRLSLSKSEGVGWFDGLAADFATLLASREFLQESNTRFSVSEQQVLKLRAALESTFTSPGSEQAKVVDDTARMPFDKPSRDALIQTTVERSDPSAARLMAFVTLLVLAMITVISLLTVRSIVIPVRRLVKATREVADGRSDVRVGRGGIKELDSVAQSFDQMSAQLESVRNAYRVQREGLERQVVERTYKLQQLAYQDPLTSLPNRRHLSSMLSTALRRARSADRRVGVYFLDIDNFKNINDSLGHVFGDRVLMSVANRLEELIDGHGFVARLGGDEFTLVCDDASSSQDLQEFGLLLTNAFHALLSVDDREISISVSIGASIFPEHETEPEALLRAADSALFQAKEFGRNQLAVFTPELITTAALRFSVEQRLRRALERDEFELAYQPEIDLARSDLGLVEALLRWRQPDGSLARPAEFLAVAEQSGLMPKINTWVLEAAFQDASRWHHGGWADARVAINISARQLVDRLFVEHILRLLEKWRLPARCIELELTESMLQTGATTVAALRSLRSHGFGIALDDFGTGYSSLTSLEQLPLTRVKLDGSLVAGIDSSARATAIAGTIIDLCAALGLEVTAEGIERPEQFVWFAGHPCVFLQGFLLSEALPFGEVLPFKASLSNKLQDLFLTLPSPARTVPPINTHLQGGKKRSGAAPV